MTDYSDPQLLRAFVNQGSQQAFQVLVDRFSEMVYSAALRKTLNASMAEDVSQLVFLNLAKDAPELQARENLGPWLHKIAVYQACKMIRTEERRKKREQKFSDAAFEVSEIEEDSKWLELRNVLDQCLLKLSQRDRDVIIWRYLEDLSIPEVARRAGAKEEAVRKRVQRALAKLSASCKRQGVSITGISIAALLSRHSVEATPAYFSTQIANAVFGQGGKITVAASGLTSYKSLSLGLAGAALLVGGVFLAQKKSEEKKLVVLQTIPKQALAKPLQLLEIKQEPLQSVTDEKEEPVQEDIVQVTESVEQNLTWWDLLHSDNLTEMLKNLVIAGVPDDDIQQLFTVESLSELVANEEQFASILDQVRLEKVLENHPLTGLWQKLSEEHVEGSTETLTEGDLPKDVFDFFVNRLTLAHLNTPHQPEQQKQPIAHQPTAAEKPAEVVQETDHSDQFAELGDRSDAGQGIAAEPAQGTQLASSVNQEQLSPTEVVSETQNTPEVNSTESGSSFALSEGELSYLEGLNLTRNWNTFSLDDVGTVNSGLPSNEGFDAIFPWDDPNSYTSPYWGGDDWSDGLSGVGNPYVDFWNDSNTTGEVEFPNVDVEPLTFDEEFVLESANQSLDDLYTSLSNLYFSSLYDTLSALEFPTSDVVLIASTQTEGSDLKAKSAKLLGIQPGKNTGKSIVTDLDKDALWADLNSADRVIIYLIEESFKQIEAELNSIDSTRLEAYKADFIIDKQLLLEIELSSEAYTKYQELVSNKEALVQSDYNFRLHAQELSYLDQLDASNTSIHEVDSGSSSASYSLSLPPTDSFTGDLYGNGGIETVDPYVDGWIDFNNTGNGNIASVTSLSIEEELVLASIEQNLQDLYTNLGELYLTILNDDDFVTKFATGDSTLVTSNQLGSYVLAETDKDVIWAGLSSADRMILHLVEESFRQIEAELNSIESTQLDVYRAELIEEKQWLLQFELSEESFAKYQQLVTNQENLVVADYNFMLNDQELAYLGQLAYGDDFLSSGIDAATTEISPSPHLIDYNGVGPDYNLLPSEPLTVDLSPSEYFFSVGGVTAFLPEEIWTSLSFEEQMMYHLIEETLFNLNINLSELYYASFWTEDSMSRLESFGENQIASLDENASREEIWASLSSEERMIIFIIEETFGNLIAALKEIDAEASENLLPELIQEKERILEPELSSEAYQSYLKLILL